ncbi:site-2 protease family protein [Synechococcales cyanobacterium C]|uniref:Zinc metalloprotease n=1 Tax=Petrachloros mirabilis ULC683 TaxID=2781853 RepID=A0A8K2A8L8_9CYAN|nr:site-2 protease family protein [Petrachloros mirabilis]NCJ08181.1 site-2 protease family protein [Petrachloros mirabilis ULC683]
MQQRSHKGWQVGSLFGIPLYIDTSWLFIVGLVTFVNGLAWQETYPNWGTGLAWLIGFAMALLLFGSVLLHELGHSLVALSQGTKVNSITLFLFGGIASIDEEAKTPGKAFQVAIAGPAVSFILFVLLGILAGLAATGTPGRVLGTDLAQINLVLALFNLIPGLPLDGGQILKAAVWKFTGNRFQGVHWAARVGQVLGWTAVILGIGSALLTGNFSGYWIALLGWFGLRNASNYDRFTDLQEGLLQLQAKDAMTREFRVVDAEQTLRQFADEFLLATTRAPAYFAASDGRYRGLVRVDDLSTVERSRWETEPLQAIVSPLPDIAAVVEPTPLIEVIDRLQQEKLPFLTVLSPAGAVSGIVDRGDTVRALAQQMKWAITDGDIRRIKEEGDYPANLPLPAIARTVMSDLQASDQSKAPTEVAASSATDNG